MTITVHCPSCSTAFPVDPDKVPAGGVNARCSSCASVFFVDKPDAFEDSPAEPTPDEVEVAGGAAGSAAPAAPEALPEIEEPDEQQIEEPAPAPEGDEAFTGADPFGGDGFDLPEEGGAVETEEEATETGETGDPDDWVFERDPEIDPSTLDVEPMETVESSQSFDEEEPAGWDAGSPQLPESEVLPEAPEETGEAGPAETTEAAGATRTGEAPDTLPAPEEAETEEAPSGFQFGRRDPHDKARRLARVLVSDMIMYNPERHTRALSSGTLQEDFEDEIKKSWEEYVEQVGEDIAGSTSYFSEALNDILAKGEDVFDGSPPA